MKEWHTRAVLLMVGHIIAPWADWMPVIYRWCSATRRVSSTAGWCPGLPAAPPPYPVTPHAVTRDHESAGRKTASAGRFLRLTAAPGWPSSTAATSSCAGSRLRSRDLLEEWSGGRGGPTGLSDGPRLALTQSLTWQRRRCLDLHTVVPAESSRNCIILCTYINEMKLFGRANIECRLKPCITVNVSKSVLYASPARLLTLVVAIILYFIIHEHPINQSINQWNFITVWLVSLVIHTRK